MSRVSEFASRFFSLQKIQNTNVLKARARSATATACLGEINHTNKFKQLVSSRVSCAFTLLECSKYRKVFNAIYFRQSQTSLSLALYIYTYIYVSFYSPSQKRIHRQIVCHDLTQLHEHLTYLQLCYTHVTKAITLEKQSTCTRTHLYFLNFGLVNIGRFLMQFILGSHNDISPSLRSRALHIRFLNITTTFQHSKTGIQCNSSFKSGVLRYM